jgi:hypothetical protein
MGDLKPLAQKYLDDCNVYLDWKKEKDASKDPAAVARHLENTRVIIDKKKFKMRTVLSEEVYAEEKTVSRQLADEQKAENAKREEQKKKQSEQLAQEVVRKTPQWLADWKTKLVNDLNRAPYNGPVSDTTGVQYSGIVRATAEAVTVKLPYGESILPWTRIPPAMLLKVSTSFIDPRSADAADRNWLCAVYAKQIGQLEDAKRLGGEAAKAKPEYGQMLPILLSEQTR